MAASRVRGLVAASLAEASSMAPQGGPVSLVLRSSEDLLCRNIMCEKLGGACLCRLAVCLGRCSGLQSLDLAKNGLATLPEAVLEQQHHLRHLDISDNAFTSVPPAVLQLSKLTTLSLSGNPLTLASSQVVQMQQLRQLHLSAGQLSLEAAKQLRTERPELDVTWREEG
ncbi:leucine rich repeat protein [Tribonema minus]|uniref:Leucine rich repeat protein n=1 Tax=Tribonema minus TaxID=303371 RepID=A0A836CFY3_9STRA|nr:leucine rich repeat protein [Tribonema minus]